MSIKNGVNSSSKTIPITGSGLVLGGLTYMSNVLVGLDHRLFIGGMAVSGLIAASDLIKGWEKHERFFKAVGLECEKVYPRVIKNTKELYGYNLIIDLPKGLELDDFEKHREALEQYLNAEVVFTYRNGKIHARVSNTKLMNTYPFIVHKTNKPTEIVIGYSREGIVTIDLEKAVHMLISGQTGSGKSVALRSILSTVILTKRSDEVQLHLVDFKLVELGIFKRSEHVKTFCKTPEELEVLLDRLGAESMKRYRLLEKHGYTNISTYNQKHDPLPYQIVVIDEFATLAGKKYRDILDKLQDRLAKDRAAGIHYITCTQRPSHTVLPGDLKANIPTVLCFKTVNSTNSEIVLDQTGAERLRGEGHGLLKTNDIKMIQTMYLSETKAVQLIKHTFTDREAEFIPRSEVGGVLSVNQTRSEGIRSNRKV